MVISLRDIKEEILKIRTYELTKTASLIVERILWIVVAIIGFVWFISFTSSQIVLWNTHKTLVSKARLKLSDIDYPATTFCSKSANKYGIVERFGNHLNPKGNLDHDFLSWIKRKALECSLNNHVQVAKEQIGHNLYEDICTATPSYYPCQVSPFQKYCIILFM